MSTYRGTVHFQYRLGSGSTVTIERDTESDTVLGALRESIEHIEEVALQQLEGEEQHLTVQVYLRHVS